MIKVKRLETHRESLSPEYLSFAWHNGSPHTLIDFLLFPYVSAMLTLFVSLLRKFDEKEPLAVSGVVNISTASVCER